ncbi:MAG TPA: cupin domain-containing protein [Kofleriaceae bacterium]|nr:cupin domain-containing protein [Kofleriaceae bacterium]
MDGVTPYTADSPPTGEHFLFRTSARGPTKKFGFQWTLKAGKRGPGEHMHPLETETFSIVSGVLRIWIEGVPRDYHAGETVAIPPNTRHRFLNPGKEPVVVDVTLDGTEMEDVFMPFVTEVGRGKKPTMRGFVRWIVHMGQHPKASVPTSRIARGIGAAVVGLCRLFGARAYPCPAPAWEDERVKAAA